MMVIPLIVVMGVLMILVWDDARTDTVEREETRIRIDRDLTGAAETITIPFMDDREQRLFDFNRPFDPGARMILQSHLGRWCDANLVDRVVILKDIERQCTHLAFQNERDAFLFKMTWF